jgi:2-succinyl-5-enolpyruvyl-6-hydroxy-3-cyclohexene-1-carboxylate synthase
VSARVDVNTSFATTFVDELVRSGVRYAVVAPGSRNTPLVLALARDGRITLEVVVDERSAAFRALGIGLATGTPPLVCCTSGTAAANFHPAVLEAHHARVPMLVCTADRPPELRDVGAGQTIDQFRLFGGAVRWFHDPGPPSAEPAAPMRWRALACRAVATALGPPAGPVHLNLPFREPLVPTGEPLVPAPGRANGAPWTQRGDVRIAVDPTELTALVRSHARGLVVAGWGAGTAGETAARFAAAAGWPLLADPISSCRTGPDAISTYEALLRVETFAATMRPDIVVRAGAPLTSKIANQWLAAVPHALIDPDRAWLDPDRTAAHTFAVPAEGLLAAAAGALDMSREPTPWAAQWRDAERRARTALDRALDASNEPIEGRIARDLAAAIPDGGTLLVASSLPVRALEWCMAPRRGLRVLANRGVNGIDGFVSTAAGIARAASGAPTVALCGDLCFLHDTNGLLTTPGPGARLTYVVVDNDGGGIFSYLPQYTVPEFEELFGTPHGLDLVEVARAHGVAAVRVEEKADWPAVLDTGVAVVVVPVDRATSAARHGACWDAVAATFDAG